MAEATVYYVKNVKYFVGVRLNARDYIGQVLTAENPYVSVPAAELRAFKQANKTAIKEGLIIEAEEPNVDWETPNALSDTEINELLKSFMKLKARLEDIDSLSILFKFQSLAKEQNKSQKVLDLISTRIEALNPIEDPRTVERGVE